ncbi:MAG: hypothetical protein LCH46_06045 [Proteobacteria bacterium]|nr:hypothetical protein [Pseudomonadota bacterium]
MTKEEMKYCVQLELGGVLEALTAQEGPITNWQDDCFRYAVGNAGRGLYWLAYNEATKVMATDVAEYPWHDDRSRLAVGDSGGNVDELARLLLWLQSQPVQDPPVFR